MSTKQQDTREAARAVISDAFYEARNQGLTMESACDTAADGVARMIADAEQAAERRGAVKALRHMADDEMSRNGATLALERILARADAIENGADL